VFDQSRIAEDSAQTPQLVVDKGVHGIEQQGAHSAPWSADDRSGVFSRRINSHLQPPRAIAAAPTRAWQGKINESDWLAFYQFSISPKIGTVRLRPANDEVAVL
jgi:hypothetical protein